MNEQHNLSPSLLDPTRWGLPAEAVTELPGCLWRFWQRYRPCFHTRTRDPSRRAYDYLSALLYMEEKRNFAEIGRTMKEYRRQKGGERGAYMTLPQCIHYVRQSQSALFGFPRR